MFERMLREMSSGHSHCILGGDELILVLRARGQTYSFGGKLSPQPPCDLLLVNTSIFETFMAKGSH